MRLFIRIVDGVPSGHPMQEKNFMAVFPHIDINNLSSDFAEFTRVEPPNLEPYEVHESTSYVLDGSVYKDVHNVRDMTDSEVEAKKEMVHQDWKKIGFSSWTFNDEKCYYEPPVAYPDDENNYKWDESKKSWVEVADD